MHICGRNTLVSYFSQIHLHFDAIQSMSSMVCIALRCARTHHSARSLFPSSLLMHRLSRLFSFAHPPKCPFRTANSQNSLVPYTLRIHATHNRVVSTPARTIAMSTLEPPSKRVLSIQSHVTSGYVGNRAAVFPLQLLGYDVDILNSCHLSNHTGYKFGAPGPRLSGEEMKSIMNGMQQNELLPQISHLLTGYIGTASCLNAIVEAVDVLREQSEQPFTYVCDPVLGDNGKLYVTDELVNIYKSRVLYHASLLTPNLFELAILSEMPVENERQVFEACDLLHKKYQIPFISVTGTCFETPKTTISVLVSCRLKGNLRFAVDTPYINGAFTGTGDVLSALLLAWNDKLPEDPKLACGNAVASVSAILERTIAMPKAIGLCPFPELRLIQSQNAILEPPSDAVSIRDVNDT